MSTREIKNFKKKRHKIKPINDNDPEIESVTLKVKIFKTNQTSNSKSCIPHVNIYGKSQDETIKIVHIVKV